MKNDDDDFDGSNDPAPTNLALEDRIKELMGMDLKELFELGQKRVVATLVALAEAGQMSHQEIAAFRNLLRDNGIMMTPKTDEQAAEDASRPAAEIPEFDDPDYER